MNSLLTLTCIYVCAHLYMLQSVRTNSRLFHKKKTYKQPVFIKENKKGKTFRSKKIKLKNYIQHICTYLHMYMKIC